MVHVVPIVQDNRVAEAPSLSAPDTLVGLDELDAFDVPICVG